MHQSDRLRESCELAGAATRSASQPRPSPRSRLLSGGLWALAGKILGGVVIVATNILLARILTPVELGGYFLALSLVSVCATVAPVGLNRAVVRFIAESTGADRPADARAAVRHAMYVGVGGSLALAAAMYLGLGGWLAREIVHSRELADSVGLVAVWIVPTTITLMVAEIFRGFHDLRSSTIHGGLLASLLALAIFALLRMSGGRLSLSVVIGVSLAAATIGVVVAMYVLHERVRLLPRSSSTTALMRMLKVSVPLFITTATVLVLSQADIWFLGAFKSQQDVAVYAAAAKLVVVVSIPLAIVNAVIQPMIAEFYSQRRNEELQRLLRVAASIAALPAVAALVFAMVFASPTLTLLYGDVYASGTNVLIILALGQVVNVWTGSCAIVLMMTGHERALMALTGLTSFISVVLMALLVGPFGITGVAVGSAIGVSLQNVVLWIAARRFAGVWTNIGLKGLGDVLRLLRTEVGRQREGMTTRS